MKAKALSLRQTASSLELSEQWVRRQLRKKLGNLGANAFKDTNGKWWIPVAIVESEKKRLDAKYELARKRRSGEVARSGREYLPEKVRAPILVASWIGSIKHGLTSEELDKVSKLLARMNASETKLWRARQKANTK